MANADAGMEPRWQHLLGDANDETDPPGFQLHGFIDHNLNGVYIRSRETTPGHINNRYLSYRCLSTGIFMWYQEKKQRYCVSFPTDPVHGDLWQRVKTGEEWAVAWYRPIFSAAGSVGELEDRWMEQNPQTGLLDLHPRGAITYKKLERAEVFAYLRARGSMAPPETSEPPRRSVPSTNPYTPAPRPGNVTPTSLLPALAGDAAPSAANRPGNVTPTSLLPALAGDAAPSAANRPGNVTPTSLLPALAGDAAPSAANRPGNVTPTSLLPALAGDATTSAANRPGNVTPTSLLPTLAGDATPPAVVEGAPATPREVESLAPARRSLPRPKRPRTGDPGAASVPAAAVPMGAAIDPNPSGCRGAG